MTVLPVARPGPVRTGVGLARDLARHGRRVALRAGATEVRYDDLARRVEARAAVLGPTRRLVLLTGANRVETLVTYLAALSAGHPVLLVPGDHPEHVAALVETYDPDVVAAEDRLDFRRTTGRELHPDLALLLSTSGSTGSPKLVRLSAENVQANAAAIAEYLRIRPGDVAATTLPMHYCYGLSVIHSHLLAGATLLLTEHSVVDRCFWEEFREAGGTTFAAVPYTFELLDRVGFEQLELPSLRYVTQAGGRLAPDKVRRFAELGRRRGWDLFVMYGQTEATARMAYLPPDLALSSPAAIGVPVPGGSFRLEPLPETPLARDSDPGIGELVYDGPNVMMGYATSPADLALGREVTSLRTGDVARRTPEGLYEVVGRRSRMAKIFGLRIDLDQVEHRLAETGVLGVCATARGADEERLVVAVCDDAAPVDTDRVARTVRSMLGLPPAAVVVRAVREVPRLPNGKPDYRAVAEMGGPITKVCRQSVPSHGKITMGTHNFPAYLGNRSPGTTQQRLCQAYAEVLGREVVTPGDSFVSLEGDSLSYVEMSIRLEGELGNLPAGWHTTPIRDLAGTPPERRRGRSVETNVLLRALAILAIVASHANLLAVAGGAHLLLGVAGFNLGRFHVSGTRRAERTRHLLTSVARVVVPSVLLIGLFATWTSGLGWRQALLLNGVLGSRDWVEPAWHYWFIEALVYTLLGVTVLLSVPAVDRLERRWPFWLPMGLAGVALLTRYDVVQLLGGDEIHRAHVVFWLFALGWAAVKAATTRQRLLVSAVLGATVWGFFDDPAREAVVVAGLLALVWVRSVRVPSWLARPVAVLAGASLYIYLVHWQVYPWWEDTYPLLATALSLAAGIAVWLLAERLTRWAGRTSRR